MQKVQQTMRRGFTLIEIVMVLLILAILAGIVVPLVGGLSHISTPGGPKSDRQIVTETSMQNIRDTIISTETRSGVWADLGHFPNRLPRTIGQMFSTNPPFPGTPPFDPVTKIGWRGPYLNQPTRFYPDIDNPDTDWLARNFTDAYGDEGDPAFADAWGNPIVLQIDFNNDDSISPEEAQASRLVSAGANGTIDWPLNPLLTHENYLAAYQSHQIDDVVIYLGITQ